MYRFILVILCVLNSSCALSRVAVVMAPPEEITANEFVSLARLLENEMSQTFGFEKDLRIGDSQNLIFTKVDDSWGIVGFGIEYDGKLELWISGPTGFEDSDLCYKIKTHLARVLKGHGLDPVISLRKSIFYIA